MNRKQMKDFVENYHYTYSGMKKALVYFYEIKKNDISKANGGIGIIPYVYRDAYNYYYTLWLANQKNENKVIIQTTGNGDLNTLVYSLYGKETADCLLPVDYQYDDIKVTGVIGKPEIARSNRSNQMFFVNKRFSFSEGFTDMSFHIVQ